MSEPIPASNTPWFELEGSARASALASLVSETIKSDGPRIDRYRRGVSRYEIRALDTLSPNSYQIETGLQLDDTETRWPFGRIVVRTVLAKVAGTQQPKVQFVASNSDWYKRRKAKRMDQVIEGLWSTRQEPYCDIWELGVHALRDALVCDNGYVKVIGDEDAGRLLHERVLPEDVFFPLAEQRYGAPQTMIHRWDASRTTLKTWYPNAAELIDQAGTGDRDELHGVWKEGDLGQDRCMVYEVWRLPDGVDKEGNKVGGSHVVLLAGTNEALVDEDWDRDSFPILSVSWDRAMRGCFGCSCMDETDGWEQAFNELLSRLLDTARRTSMNVISKHENTEIKDGEVTQDASIVEWFGTIPPDIQTPPPLNPVWIDVMRWLKDIGFDASGVNQMSATAQKQPGITANSALLTLADLQTEIFSVVWRAYQQLFVDIARQDLLELRALVKKNPKLALKWRMGDFMSEVKASDLDIDDQFELAIQSAPSSKGTAAGRLQSAEEAAQAGMISRDALFAIRQFFDTPREFELAGLQRGWVEHMIEAWLDATPDQIATGLNENGAPLMPAPIKWMKLEDAIVQVADQYMEALLKDAPPDIQRLFLDWLSMADQALSQKQAAAAALQAGGAPPEAAMAQNPIPQPPAA
jgi:hypothetical protein